MGYRSDFVFIIHSNGDQNALAKFWVWLHAKAEYDDHRPNRSYAYSGWYTYFINNVDEKKSAPFDDYLYWEDSGIKLYDFDSVKDDIKAYAENELGLDWEYVCIGEDKDDITEEASGNCDRRAWITRSIQVD